MKNHYNPQRFLQTLMRVTFLAILITGTLSGVLGAASTGHAQGEELAGITVQLDAENTTVEQVLKDLEQQTGLTFGYSHAYMDLDRRVTIKNTSENINLEEALKQIYSGTRTTWVLDNGVVQLKTWPEKNTQTGVIAGSITDAKTGEPMPGATMQIKGTTRGAAADQDGQYRLEDVPPGTYTLVFSFVGYKQTRAEGIQVEEDQVTTVDASLVPKTAQMEEVVVEAEIDVATAPVIESTEIDVVNTISESNLVVSGISAEQISKSPDSDAAEVVRRAPGVTLTGSYVNLRGLSDRHTATFIDGMNAPSTAKYSSSFSYDLLPAGVIDQVLTYKSPAAELPGDWGGGVVKIFTKNTSVARELQVSVKGAYNTVSSFSDYYTHQSSSTDWLGYDGGTRRIPDKFYTYDFNDESKIQNIAAARLLPETWNMQQAHSGGNWSGKLRYYDSWKPFGLRVNNLTALKYSRSTDIQDSFFGANYLNRARATIIDENGNTTPIPEEERISLEELKQEGFNSSDDVSYTEKVRISGLQNLGFWINDHHRIRLKNMINQLGNSRTFTRIGDPDLFNRDIGADAMANVEYNYQQRTLYNGQLSGEHGIGANQNHQVNWQTSYSYGREQVPDRRIMEFEVPSRNASFDTLRGRLQLSNSFDLNSRVYTDSREDIYTVGLDYRWETPWGPTLKAGGYAHNKKRDYSSRLITFNFPTNKNFNDKLTKDYQTPWFIVDDSLFIDDHYKTEGGYLSLQTDSGQPDSTSSFRAESKQRAAYLSAEIPLFGNTINLYGGLRAEWTDRNLVTYGGDSTDTPRTRYFLPSGGITANLSETVQLRATVGKTLDRPSLREASTFYFFDATEFISVSGNPELQDTQIWNYDLRAEWYPRAGEQLSVGGFYKTLDDPIERMRYRYAKSNNLSWVNTNEATVYGAELEVRKRLDFIPTGPFQFLSVFSNATWLHSEVRADSVQKRGGDYIALPFGERQLQGAAPYIINAGLNFEHPGWGTQASVLYNIVGPKLLQAPSNVMGITFYGIYERRYQRVDLQFSQELTPWLQIDATVENLFNARRTEFVDANGTQKWDQGVFKPVPRQLNVQGASETTDSIYRRYGKAGRTFSVSLKMTL